MRAVLRTNYPDSLLFDAMVRKRRAINGKPKTVDSGDPDISNTIAELRFRQYELGCIAINLPFGLHRFIDRPVAYFALVREPVSRSVSQWYFLRAGAHDNGRSRALLAQFDFDVEKVLASPVGMSFSNDQVRLLSGSMAETVGRAEFDLARDVIEHRFLLVGTVDRFDECLAALAQRLRWATIDYRLQNVGDKSDRSLLSKNAEGLFLEANEWDTKLYEWISKTYLSRRLRALERRRVA